METSQQITNTIAKGTEEHFAWLKTIMTLSSGALTLLVSFQSKYSDSTSHCLWLLQSSWALLALSTVLALIATSAAHQIHFDVALQLQKPQSYKKDAEGRLYVFSTMRPLPKLCGQLTPVAFSLAVIAIAVFGILNTQKTPQENANTAPTSSRAANETRRH